MKQLFNLCTKYKISCTVFWLEEGEILIHLRKNEGTLNMFQEFKLNDEMVGDIPETHLMRFVERFFEELYIKFQDEKDIRAAKKTQLPDGNRNPKQQGGDLYREQQELGKNARDDSGGKSPEDGKGKPAL